LTFYTRTVWRLRGSPLLRWARERPWGRRLESIPAVARLRGVLTRGLVADAAPGGAPAEYAIERYSFFQGVLHVVGTLCAAQPVRALALRLPSGANHSLRFSAAAPGRTAFDQVLAIAGPDGVELSRASLVATLADGGQLRIDSPGAHVGDPAHALLGRFLSLLAERPPGALLEIGARARSGVVRRDLIPPGWDYSGFDLLDGPNVDVVGDAHRLSRHYPGEQFDAVMAFSVLEHLLMPWKVVLELNRVLKPGAIGLFTTHQCWPLHDEPWDFWRFSDTAWGSFLNAATGFEVISAQMGEPAFVVARKCTADTAFTDRNTTALASFVLFRKIGPTRLEWPVEPGEITASAYPTTPHRRAVA
jgi:hypothetical protein